MLVQRSHRFLLTHFSLLLSLRRSLGSMASAAAMTTTTPHVERTDGTIIVYPANEAKQNALVVISHGLGDSSEGFADVAEHLATKMPHCKFILPTAPVQPVTLNGGMKMTSWYDIVGLDERSNEKCEGIQASRERLEGILRREHEQLGLPYSRMVLAGFSQGGALSLFTGLQFTEKLAGIAVLSGYLPAASQVNIAPGLEPTPVWHGHGTQDMIVPYQLAVKSKDLVQQKGLLSYTLQSYSIGHTVSMPEIADLHRFLTTVLPDDDDNNRCSSFRVTIDPTRMSIKELKAAIRRANLSHKAIGLCEKEEFIKLLQEHYNAESA